ncbi:MAG: response regulator, partial [Desulfobulbaceae bacterium]|nr:response regulator [Desulfobulbaceae bacterium]
MKIKTKLLILGAFPLFLALIISGVHYWRDQRLARAARLNREAMELITHVVEFDSLVSEFLHSPEEIRPRHQWIKKQETINLFLARIQFSLGKETDLATLIDSFATLRSLLEKEVHLLESGISDREEFDKQEHKILHKMLLTTQIMAGETLRIGDEITEKSDELRRITDNLVFSIILGICFFSGGIALYLGSRITVPLKILHRGIKNISTGVLTQQLPHLGKDELGALGETFNVMSSRLRITTLELQQQLEDTAKAKEEAESARREVEASKEVLLETMKELEEATRAKSEFLANMSHEIRTPMNAIMGMTLLAMQTNLDDRQKDYLEKIDHSAQSLLTIINDILDFSKIEAGQLQIENTRFLLEEVLNTVSDMITIRAQKKGLEVAFNIDPDIPQTLMGDPLRLGQILINLTNNAVKFTHKGEIVVSVTQLHSDATCLLMQFEVRDTGIGIEPEKQKSLFQAFSQADTSTTRKYGGTGLGLAICKQLTELMGGELTVTSMPGRGSVFTFSAILGRCPETKAKPLLPPEELRNSKVLVVDDNKLARDILSNMLQSYSFEVETASSGTEAIDMIRGANEKQKPFKLVLMDWNMPELNGIEVSRRIKSDTRLSQIPLIIMITAYGREEIVNQAHDLGLEAFLVKPVSRSTLFDTIMSVFGKNNYITHRQSKGRSIPTCANISSIAGAEILLVEDNLINQQIAKELLKFWQLNVTIANNGKEALEKLGNHPYDLILMDIQMPEMDGLTATREIRKIETAGTRDTGRGAPIPIIAMTAHALVSDKEKSLAAGMNEHIAKPLDPKELLACLMRFLPTEQIAARAKKICVRNRDKDRHPSLPESIEGIDIENGLYRVACNQKLYLTLLRDFLRDYKEFPRLLRTTLD